MYEKVLLFPKRAVIENNFKKKKMKLLTKEQQESHENGKICYICKEEFENNYLKDKKYHKIRDHCNFTRGGGVGGCCAEPM